MPTVVRLSQRGRRVALRQLVHVGDELRDRRLELGLSQRVVARAAGIDRSRLTRIEAANVETLRIVELARIASVLGLDSVVRLYPGGTPLRDTGQARRLSVLLGWVHTPLTARVEVSLPSSPDRPEQRAWDAAIFGHGERTTVELEVHIRDAQAMKRRHDLKRRDDPAEHFLLVIADTRHNRRVLAEFAPLFAELPHLRPKVVRAALEGGSLPPTGYVLI